MQRITIGAVLPYSLTANDVQDIEVLRAKGHVWFQRAAALVFGLLVAALCLAPSVAFAQDAAPAQPTPSIWLQVLGGLASLVSVALVPLLGLLTAYLRSKAAESKAARVGIVLNEAAIAAVHELDATLKPQLQAALADGVLTDAEKAQLKATAVELLKTKLPPALLSMAGDLFGAFTDTLVAGKIEQAVAAKNAVQAAGDKPASPPTP